MWFVYCEACIHSGESNRLPSNYLPNSNIGIDSTFYMYGKPKLDFRGIATVKIFEVYKLMGSWKKKQWAIWNSVYGLQITQAMIWERRRDLTGLSIRCASATVTSLFALAFIFQ